jgi:hypothetical protein
MHHHAPRKHARKEYADTADGEPVRVVADTCRCGRVRVMVFDAARGQLLRSSGWCGEGHDAANT